MQRQLILAAMLFAPLSARAAVLSDNFDDNVTGSAWTKVVDDPSLTIVEQAGRLDLLSTASNSPNNDALYLSTGPAGFRLSTAADFSIGIDYSYLTSQAVGAFGDRFGLVFGVGKDVEGFNSAAIGLGYGSAGAFALSSSVGAYRINDAQTQTAPDFAAPTAGRFVIAYDAAGDDLTLTYNGRATPLLSLDNTVRGVWGASDLLVSFGGRGQGFTTVAGQSYLDNFSIETGTLVPEPASFALLSLLGLTLYRRRV